VIATSLLAGIAAAMAATGILGKPPELVTYALIVPSAGIVVLLGALMLGLIRVTEFDVGGVKGVFVQDDHDFQDFARPSERDLRDFARLMGAEIAEATEIVEEALKRTRVSWRRGAAQDPLLYTLRALLHLLINPTGWRLLHPPGERPHRRRSIRPDGKGERLHVPGLEALEFNERAAFLLDSLLGLPVADIAALLGCEETAVDELLAAASARFEVAHAG
jgi:hypothetical protein